MAATPCILTLDPHGERELEKRLAQHEAPERDGRWLKCSACGNRVALSADRLELHGAHQHVFTNPHGIEFRIRLYLEALGCALHGAGTEEWTWFSGYQWRIGNCHRCQTHLGWGFRATSAREPAGFYGLISARLLME